MVLGRRSHPSPSLAPELDDADLGRVLKHALRRSAGQFEMTLTSAMQVIEDSGTDWDRKGHRLGVLASTVGRGLPRTLGRRHAEHQGMLLLHTWTQVLQARRDGAQLDLATVQDACYRAADQQAEDPNPWIVLLGALRQNRRPRVELAPVWQEIMARDPWNRQAYLEILGYLSPDECGSSVQIVELIDELRQRMPPDVPTVALELTAIARRYRRTVAEGGPEALHASQIWTRADSEHALTVAARSWTRPGFLSHAAAVADLNILAYGLLKAARMDEASAALQATGALATAWPWETDGDPLDTYAYWYRRLVRKR